MQAKESSQGRSKVVVTATHLVLCTTASTPCSLIDMHAFVSHARPEQRSVDLSFIIFSPKCLDWFDRERRPRPA